MNKNSVLSIVGSQPNVSEYNDVTNIKVSDMSVKSSVSVRNIYLAYIVPSIL